MVRASYEASSVTSGSFIWKLETVFSLMLFWKCFIIFCVEYSTF